MSQKLYKMRLVPNENGLQIVTEQWICIHETKCFYHCVSEWDIELLNYLKSQSVDKTKRNIAQERKLLKRIAKHRSRFAFDTKEKAMKHLKFLKRKQLKHMQRDQKFINAFLSVENLEENCNGQMVIPNTQQLVLGYYLFD